MQGRNPITTQSQLEEFARRHPFATFSIVKRLFPKAVKVKSHFADEQFHYDGQVVAEILHENEFPILNIYTTDPIIAAKANAELMGKYVVGFYIDYLQFLAYSLSLNPGPILADHLKEINIQASRRQLNFDRAMRLHFLYQKVNDLIAHDNQQHSYFMQLKLLNVDFFKGFFYLCDIYKGLGLKKQPITPGCTLAILPEHLSDDSRQTFMHIVDWLSLNKFRLISLCEPTGNSSEKSQWTVSIDLAWTDFPNTIVNEYAAFGLNEAANLATMRRNPNKNALQQFALMKKMAVECDNLDDLNHFLQEANPASTHSVGYQFADGSYGKLEYLPPSFPEKLFLQIGYDSSQSHLDQKPVYFTNGCMSAKSVETMDFAAPAANNTSAIEDSDERAKKTAEAIKNSKNAEQIMQKPSNQYSVAAIYIKSKDGKTDLYINTAPTDSGNAIDPETKKVQYTHLDLTALGKQFMMKVKSVNACKAEVIDHLDSALIDLLKLAHLAGSTYPQLADNLNKMYDVLSTEQRNVRLNIAPPTIQMSSGITIFITELNQLVQNLLDKKEINTEKFEKLISESALVDADDEIVNSVFTGIAVATLSHIVISFATGSSPLDFARNLITNMIEDFMQTSTRNLVISASVGALAAKPIADRLFNNKSAITLFAEKICVNIDKIDSENKQQLKH